MSSLSSQKRGKHFAFAAATVCAFAASQALATTYNLSDYQNVTTSGGTFSQIHGHTDPTNDSVQRFLGIPFAAPPMGALRWKAPADPSAWTGPRDATYYRSQCTQVSTIFDPLSDPSKFGTVTGSEDCLYLNVFRPKTSQDNLPVMYWISGGGNLAGGANDPAYEAAKFAKQNNVVVVTVNYRLGMLGFLYEGALATSTSTALDKSGNFATLDLVKGLDWVNKNIATFGGNKNNVTVAGESAGCINTWGLVQTPLAAGKFQKAICMSGIPNMYPTALGQGFANQMETNLIRSRNPGMSFTDADNLRKSMTPAQIASLLRGATAAEIIANTPHPVNPGHFMDGTVIPATLGVPGLLSCNYNKVPMMISNVDNEGSLFVGAEGAWKIDQKTLWSMMNFSSPTPSDGAIIKPEWLQAAGQPFSSSPYYKSDRMFTDLISYTSDQITRYLQTQVLCGPKAVYRYHFKWKNMPQPWVDVFGSEHALDVPFMFGTFPKPSFSGYAYTSANQADRQDMFKLLNYYYGNFLWNGDPNNSSNNPNIYASAPYWNAWTNLIGFPKRMNFNASLGQANAGSASSMSASENLAVFADLLTLPPNAYSFTSGLLKSFIPQTWQSTLGITIP